MRKAGKKITITGYKETLQKWDWDGEKYTEEALLVSDRNGPYLEYIMLQPTKMYNPDYGDTRMCKCGHHYYRHFDTYEDMNPCGCKYCRCRNFVEQVEKEK